MKTFLMPATAVSVTKKVAFAILCCTLLMFIPAPAWADQCSAPTVGVGTGAVGSANGSNTCGAVITVLTATGGSATSFTVIATGNGNPYDGTEDSLVGIQNNSGMPLSSITLSGTDIFGFDGDGPCSTVYHTPLYSWCPATYADPVGYEGPDNTFNTSDSNTGTVHFTTAIPNGGSTWFALEGTPQSIGGQTQTQALSANENDFTFNTPGATTIQKIIYANSGFDPTMPPPGLEMQVTYLAISDFTYQNLVANTFAQGSKCMPQQINTNTFSCAVAIELCRTIGSGGPFLGSNCTPPGGTPGPIGVIAKYSTNAFNNPTDVPSPGYLFAKDNALSCASTDNACKGLSNIFTNILNDCCTTGGGTKQFNSLSVPNYCLDNVTSVDRFNVVGFSSPVDNPGSGSTPVVNNINSKQGVPLKLTVGCQGTPVNNLDLVGSSNPATIHSVVLSVTNAPANTCATNVVDNNITINTAGASGWQISPGGVYTYVWKPAAPVGSCLLFSVNLGDGVQHSAYFQITK